MISEPSVNTTYNEQSTENIPALKAQIEKMQRREDRNTNERMEAARKEGRERFARFFEVKLYNKGFSFLQLVRGNWSVPDCWPSYEIWGNHDVRDHPEYWTRGGKPYAITAHLYSFEEYRAACVEFAQKAGLELVILDAPSWYGWSSIREDHDGSKTTAVMYRRVV